MKKRPKAIPFEEFKKNLLRDPGVRRAYENLQTEYEVASQIIEARIKKKVSQEQLAKKAKTGQAVISRLEGMNAKPSISLLRRIARALGTEFRITIR